jgi:hypothetical protein
MGIVFRGHTHGTGKLNGGLGLVNIWNNSN